MAESAARVPIPFYPPVRTGTGALLTFGRPSRRPLLLEQQTQINAPEADDGMAYRRDGRLLSDTRIGMWLNIYV